METTTGKRIVSKGEYAAVKTGAYLMSSGTVLCGLAIVLLVLALPYTFSMDVKARAEDPDPMFSFFMVAFLASLVLLPLLFLNGYLLLRGSRSHWKIVHNMNPLTRANTADLPAHSLVRASSEPPQEQQAELLRAAQGVETQVEELVRTSVGQE